MKLSADRKSPHYSELANVAKILFNSEYRSDCFEVDTIEGYAIIYERDSDGEFIIENDELKMKKIYGKVEIELPEEYNKFL